MPRLLPLATFCYRLGDKKATPLPAHPGGRGWGREHLQHSGLSESSARMWTRLLQQPLLIGDLLKVLGLVSVLLHLSVQHLQHGL